MSNVVISSLWRNDGKRHLDVRAAHLLSKTNPSGAIRWVWVVGDSDDDTEMRLHAIAAQSGCEITLIRHDTGIKGDSPAVRLHRLSETANAAFKALEDMDDLWLIHESDLVSPSDLVWRLLTIGGDVVSGWPTLNGKMYDIWAYSKDGRLFNADFPFHPCYRPDQPFELDSVGSVMMFPAEQLRRGVRFYNMGVRDLCKQFKDNGLKIWCDPSIEVIQPVELWSKQEFA